MNREITETIIHWKDKDGKEGMKVYEGDCDFGAVYMRSRKPDLTKPLGHLIPDERKYRLVEEKREPEKPVRYSYYEEM